MTSQVKNVSEYKVGNWTDLQADFSFLNQFNEVWVESKMESVTDSLGSKKNGVVELSVLLIIGLTNVQVNGEFST